MLFVTCMGVLLNAEWLTTAICISRLCQIQVIQQNILFNDAITLILTFLCELSTVTTYNQNCQCSEYVSSSWSSTRVVANEPEDSHIHLNTYEKRCINFLWRNEFDSRSSYLDDLWWMALDKYTSKSFIFQLWFNFNADHYALLSLKIYISILRFYFICAFSYIGPPSWKTFL